jgi:hypothetical protein
MKNDEQDRNALGASLLSEGLEGTCKKCGGAMKPGKAIAQMWTGIPDFPGDKHCVTISPDGSGKLIDCMKCEKCGWSMTSNV